MAEPFNYAGLIHRHFVTRLRSFPPGSIQRILSHSGLEVFGETVRSRGDETVGEGAAFRYKQAIKEILGVGAYEMTKLNFILAGCLCQDCRSGL